MTELPGPAWVDRAATDLRAALDDFVAEGGAPGGVGVVGDSSRTKESSRTREVVAVGIVAPECGPTPPDGDTRYDIASITKVIATWPLIGFAVRDGLDIDVPIGRYLPELPADLPSVGVTIRQLLAHTSGMLRPTRLDLYRGSDRPLTELICAEPLDHPPGMEHRYLSRSYILLALLLPRLLDVPFDQAASDLVWAPAGMARTAFGPVARTETTAPTERYFADAPRLWGQAHDDNARLLGGVAGHAGAFSTANDLARFADWLSSPECPLADWWEASLEPQVMVPPGSPSEGAPVGTGLKRGLAWLLLTDTGVAYHDGFTGASLYLAPSNGRYLALCTNAIYGGRARPGLRKLRERALEVLQT